MTGIRLEDLPATVRARIRDDGEQRSSGSSSRRTTRRGSQRAGWTYRCHECGAENRAWAPAQRHANEAGHGRVELVL